MNIEPFTPESSYIKMRRFHAWVQTIVPFVYDNSLSFYEVLDKMAEYLNEIRDRQNQLSGLYDSLVAWCNDAIAEQTDFIQKFTDNLRAEWNQFSEDMKNQFKELSDEIEQELTDFETKIQEQQNAFETKIQQQQNDFETKINGQVETWQNEWNTYKTNLNEAWNEYQNTLNTAWTNYQDNLNTEWTDTKNYVDNYFENLDVTTELQSIISQMLASGELESIIGAYINANAVLGFNTINDLKSSENLINGSFAQTIGSKRINDGKDNLYKIRNATTSDNVDNDNIVEINDTLVAEKIKSIPVDYTILVDINGNGDYTSLTTAVQNATNGDIIYVKKGTYNNEIVNCVGKNLTIIGENEKETIIQNDYDDYTKTPLNIGQGLVENISFKQNGAILSNNHSYAAHIDNNDLYNNSLVFKNVYFYSKSTASAGIGTKNNCELIFDTCIFESENTTEMFEIGALFIHNANNPTYQGNNQNVTINNCIVISKYQSALHLQYCGNENNILYIKSYNSIYKSLNSDIQCFNGVVTSDYYDSDKRNILIDQTSHGNNIENMNASKYVLKKECIAGIYSEQSVDSTIKRYVTYQYLTNGKNTIDLPFEIDTPVSCSIFIQNGNYWFPAVTHSGDSVNVINYDIYMKNKLEITTTITGIAVVVLEYV